jgi:hypothetical protein
LYLRSYNLVGSVTESGVNLAHNESLRE